MRNTVKVVWDACSGDVTFYTADKHDPIVGTYQRIYPSLFAPLSAMPSELRTHLRYPEDLFTVQADVFRSYHMTDPRIFLQLQ
jgi:uncharacterized membrane protein (UPF0182 family)